MTKTTMTPKKNKPWRNPEWRLENLYHIVDKDSRRLKFKRNNIQRQVSLMAAKRKMILKSRQVGISTQEILKMFDYVMFNRNVTACILAHEQDSIKKLFRIPRRAYKFGEDNPKYKLFPDVDRGGGSKHEMFFPSINSRIYCDLESRGDTIHWLHISEYAFSKEPDRVKATIESVPINGIVTIESTPNGMSNDFYSEWMRQDSNYTKCFYPWFFHEEYQIKNHGITQTDLTDDEIKCIAQAKALYKVDLSLDQIAFRRFKQRELKHLFGQEYPEDDASCFLTSGNSPWTLSILKPLFDNAPEPIDVIDDIRIYEEHQPGEDYVISGDPAEGVEGDSSAAHVFRVRDRKQVAAYHSNTDKPHEFAIKLIQMSGLYSGRYPCLIGVERNNHGHAVLLALDIVHDYPNIYRPDPDDPEKLGWITDKITRPLMIDKLIEGVENGTVKLLDRPTLGECLTVVTNESGKILAERPNHDDLFIGAAIGVEMCIEESKLGIYSDIGNKIKI